MRRDDDLVVIGRISGIYGVKGWLKVFSYTQPRENILNYSPWLLNTGEDWRSVRLVAGKKHGKGIIARLENCNDRDHAATMIGQDVGIRQEQLAVLEAGEYYWADLLGLEVVNARQELLGKVVRLIETGANDVLVVGEEEKILIPFVQPQIIKVVDLEAGRILADWEADY